MFYFLACVLTFIFLTQESKQPSTGRKELIYALCISLVWPLYVLMLALYYQNELGYTLAELFGFVIDPEKFWLGVSEDIKDYDSTLNDGLENLEEVVR